MRLFTVAELTEQMINNRETNNKSLSLIKVPIQLPKTKKLIISKLLIADAEPRDSLKHCKALDDVLPHRRDAPKR